LFPIPIRGYDILVLMGAGLALHRTGRANVRFSLYYEEDGRIAVHQLLIFYSVGAKTAILLVCAARVHKARTVRRCFILFLSTTTTLPPRLWRSYCQNGSIVLIPRMGFLINRNGLIILILRMGFLIIQKGYF
jgi:hypothetical protein